MTLEELSNIDLLNLYSRIVADNGESDDDYALEVKEEIFMRMEGGEGVA